MPSRTIRDCIKRSCGSRLSAPRFLTFRPRHQVAEGDTVATRATLRGTHLGTLFGVAPTNQQLTWSVLLMDKIVDGKIVLHHANADWLSVLVKLGVVKAPGGEMSRPQQ